MRWLGPLSLSRIHVCMQRPGCIFRPRLSLLITSTNPTNHPTLPAFFVWRVTRSGMLIDAKDVIPAPDAEAFIAAVRMCVPYDCACLSACPSLLHVYIMGGPSVCLPALLRLSHVI